MPSAEFEARPRLLLAAAWSLAIGERHEEAERLVARMLARDDIDDELRCECALIRGGAAVFADDPDRFAELHDPWAVDPPLNDPLLLQIHANRSAFRALLDGEPALARLRQQQAPRGDPGLAPGHLGRWGDFIIGLSYLWEGQVLLAESMLRPALAQAEADLGRRSPFACMLAALLAAALWERDQPRDAGALLANRLDVLERSGLPEAVLLAFRTLARIAAGATRRRALELLDATRRRGRAARTAAAAHREPGGAGAAACPAVSGPRPAASCGADRGVAGAEGPSRGRLWRAPSRRMRDLAQGYAAIAAQDWRGGAGAARSGPTPRRGPPNASAAHRDAGPARAGPRPLRRETREPCCAKRWSLAQGYGLARVFDDAHPALGDWVGRILVACAGGEPRRPPNRGGSAAGVRPRRASELDRASTALTPKEREVLELLARNLSNKEIGLAMQVGEETIKWHMKNLFAKLDAGTRKQVVSRARLLGLLAPAS